MFFFSYGKWKLKINETSTRTRQLSRGDVESFIELDFKFAEL